MESSSPFLSDAEVADLCAPLRRGAAQARYLRERLGVPVKLKPNGRPLVSRMLLERVLAGIPPNHWPDRGDSRNAPSLDVDAYLRHLAKRNRA